MARHHEAQPIDSGPYAGRTYVGPDPNFENLVSNWNRYSNRFILFLGAGASGGPGRLTEFGFRLRFSCGTQFGASGSPALFTPDCRSPEQMRYANGFCRFRELAKEVEVGQVGIDNHPT